MTNSPINAPLIDSCLDIKVILDKIIPKLLLSRIKLLLLIDLVLNHLRCFFPLFPNHLLEFRQPLRKLILLLLLLQLSFIDSHFNAVLTHRLAEKLIISLLRILLLLLLLLVDVCHLVRGVQAQCHCACPKR